MAYFGAGTKTFDELWLGEALKRLTSDQWRRLLPRNSVDYALAADANRILNSHHHDKIDSLTRARSTAFAASHVELYMRTHGNRMPEVGDVGRGDVKTPPLWHTAAKMPDRTLVHGRQFSRPVPADGLVDGAGERPAVRCAGPGRRADDQGGVRVGHPPSPAAALSVRDRSGPGRPGTRAVLLTTSAAPDVMAIYDGRGNVQWPGVHVDVGHRSSPASTSCPTGSSTRSTAVRWRRRAR